MAYALKQANLKIKPIKCKWVCKEIKLLGHVDKINVIKKRSASKNLKQLQQFLGMCNYYRKFIKDYSKLAGPLIKLLKADVKFVWSKEQDDAFKEMKNALVSYPVLKPDFSKKFYLYTDASGYCLGAVLSQKDENGKDFACAYASKTLMDAEMHYTTKKNV